MPRERSNGVRSDDGLPVDVDSNDDPDTIQLLVVNEADRTVIADMLDGRYRVITGTTVREADLYLIEDRVLPDYRADIRDRRDRNRPLFTPVVVIRGQERRHGPVFHDLPENEPPLIDDVVDAPIDSTLLVRRLHALLVRREQSMALARRVATLRERERELRSFEQAVERTGHSIIITDVDGTIEYVNPAFEEITGYPPEEALGETPSILKSGEHGKEFYAELWSTILSGEVWEGEVINERKDGQRYVVDQTIAPIVNDDGDIERFVSVNSEITDRVRFERELRQRERELDLLRQILTRVLRHNLRNGLNVIAGYAETIADEVDEPYDRMGETIVETAEELERTGRNAQTISAIVEESGDVIVHDLPEVVRDAVASVRDRYPEVTIATDLVGHQRVLASRRLPDAIDNLIENAAKHNDADEPWVRVHLASNGDVRLVVEDNGPGIPEHELEPLHRSEETPLNHASKTGLWLVNWLIEQSDGTLEFDVTDAGTRVEIRLPSPETSSER